MSTVQINVLKWLRVFDDNVVVSQYNENGNELRSTIKESALTSETKIPVNRWKIFALKSETKPWKLKNRRASF